VTTNQLDFSQAEQGIVGSLVYNIERVASELDEYKGLKKCICPYPLN